MRAVTGDSDINWTTLGTWASKTAGVFIRNEEIPEIVRKVSLRRIKYTPIEDKLGFRGLVSLSVDVVQGLSKYIMVGNRVVFDELAGCCADFLETIGKDETYDAERLAEFQSRYSEGAPEPDGVEWVDGALVKPFAKLAQKIWHDVATFTMMELYLPDQTLKLSRPLPANNADDLFPEVLRTIDTPTLRQTLAKYNALDVKYREGPLDRAESQFTRLAHIRRRPSELTGIAVGAVNWTDLDQRMQYILTLFRTRAQDKCLLQSPYTPAQRASIAEGVIPEGPL